VARFLAYINSAWLHGVTKELFHNNPQIRCPYFDPLRRARSR